MSGGAHAFAAKAHEGQVRKYTGEPYITHPAAVVEILRKVTHSPEMLAAAWLHDVVEDCGTTYAEILGKFGEHVMELVFWYTEASRPEMGNRTLRKRIDLLHYAAAPGAAQTIKVADLIDNTHSICQHDEGFARTYLKEKHALLLALDKADSKLRLMAGRMVTTQAGRLGIVL